MIEDKLGANLDNMRIVTVPPFALLCGSSEVIDVEHLEECPVHSAQLMLAVVGLVGLVELVESVQTCISVHVGPESQCVESTCQGSANVHWLYCFYDSVTLPLALNPLSIVAESRNGILKKV